MPSPLLPLVGPLLMSERGISSANSTTHKLQGHSHAVEYVAFSPGPTKELQSIRHLCNRARRGIERIQSIPFTSSFFCRGRVSRQKRVVKEIIIKAVRPASGSLFFLHPRNHSIPPVPFRSISSMIVSVRNHSLVTNSTVHLVS